MSIFNAARRGLNALTSNDTNLANLLSEEKDILTAFTGLKTSTAQAATSLTLWGTNESDDLKEITSRFDTLQKELSLCYVELEDSQTRYREKLKEIVVLTDSLAALKGKIKSCKDKLEKNIRLNKNSESIQAELGGLELQLKDETAVFENEKRRILKEAMIIQYNGIMRFSIKTRAVGEFGEHLANQIPQTNLKSGQEVPAFLGHDVTQHIIEDFEAEMYDCVRRRKPLPRDYEIPHLLNSMTSLNMSSSTPTPVVATSSTKPVTNSDLLWDASAEMASPQLAQPLVAQNQNQQPAAQPQVEQATPVQAAPSWTAYASTDGTVLNNASAASSSSSLPQLPNDFENPW